MQETALYKINKLYALCQQSILKAGKKSFFKLTCLSYQTTCIGGGDLSAHLLDFGRSFIQRLSAFACSATVLDSRSRTNSTVMPCTRYVPPQTCRVCRYFF